MTGQNFPLRRRRVSGFYPHRLQRLHDVDHICAANREQLLEMIALLLLI